MKSTAETSSGWSIQAFQISPVVTGTEVSRFTRWILRDQLVDGLLAADRSFRCRPRRCRRCDTCGRDRSPRAVHVRCGPYACRPRRRPRRAGRTRGPLPELLGSAGRRIGADHARVGRDRLEVGSDLLGGGLGAAVRMGRTIERRVGHAGKLAVEIRRTADCPSNSPNAGMGTCNGDYADNCDETHQSDRSGLGISGANPSPGWAIAATQLTAVEAIRKYVLGRGELMTEPARRPLPNAIICRGFQPALPQAAAALPRRVASPPGPGRAWWPRRPARSGSASRRAPGR